MILWLPTLGHAQFSDNFSDGDFSADPAWLGTTDLFIVNGSFQLQTNGPSQADTAFIATAFAPDFQDTVTWDFYWRMAFAPSNNNLSYIYLVSLAGNPSSAGNEGYYLRIGNTGNDSLRFYRFQGSSSTLLATGSNDYSSNPELRIRVVRYPGGTWEIWSDPTAGSNFQLEATASDNTYGTCAYFALWCKYTSSNATKFFFDDVDVQGSLYTDSDPPQLLDHSVDGPSQLTLSFSEPLEATSAQNISNYIVNNGIGAPQAAILSPDSTHVALTFSASFPIALQNTITVQGVADTAGNAIDSCHMGFVYYAFHTPGYRDLMINEIMADPTPSAGLPDQEFVEVYNPTPHHFLLTGLQLSDPSTAGTVTEFEFITPGEHVILCHHADTMSFAPYGHVIGLPQFPTLNNAGDVLTLVLGDTLLDSVAYSSLWYRDDDKAEGGFSLEQINPAHPCTDNVMDNWRATQDSTGGTPGRQNSVYNTLADTLAPELTSLWVSGPAELHLSFSEAADSLTMVQADYAINNGLNVISVSAEPPDFTQVSLTLSAPVDSALHYTVTVSGIADCAGNVLPHASASFGLGITPDPHDLVINEFYPLPLTSSAIPAVEFVELYNRTDKLLRLEGVYIGDRTSSAALPAVVVEPYEYVVVCDDDYSGLFSDTLKVAAVGSMPSLNNSDDELRLFRGLRILDKVSYEEGWYGDDVKAEGGFTLERINPGALCGLAGNWRASVAGGGGTPGAKNSVFDTLAGTPGPILTQARFTNLHEVALGFDQQMDSVSLIGAVRMDTQVLISKTIIADAGHVNAFSSEAFHRGRTYTISAEGAQNCAGQKAAQHTLELYLHDSAGVVINEVLFNPRGSGSDFVELYNRSGRDINLQGWSLAYRDSKDSLRFNIISDTDLLLASGGYIALSEDADNVLFNYPAAAPDNLYETALPAYPNEEGNVLLYDQLGTSMDRFYYSEDMHFALIDNPEGVSLERLAASRPANDAGNWHSASSDVGYATPGYINSQRYEPGSAPMAGFFLNEDYISPDNDGYQDVLNIGYMISEPGTSVTIRVFTEAGVPVRTLVSNHLAGTEGTYTWDGTNDLGEKARTGIHLVLVETFDLSGTRHTYKLPCVVAARLD